jgi:hypothetical protein
MELVRTVQCGDSFTEVGCAPRKRLADPVVERGLSVAMLHE